MSVKVGSSQTEKVFDVKKYIGEALMKVIAINPTKAELEKLGINFKEEPVYTKQADGDSPDIAYIDIYVKARVEEAGKPIDIISKVQRFFIKNTEFKSKEKGTYQWIDKFGNTTWTTEKPTQEFVSAKKQEYSWWNFDVASCRNAFPGESELIDFLRVWLKVNKGDDISLEKIKNYFKGDFSELKQLISLAPNNLFYGILMVRDEKYQEVYNKKIISDKISEGNRVSYFKKAGVNICIKATEYIPSVVPDEDSEGKSDSKIDDDTPF